METSKAGFTLLEVIVALVLGSLVLITARGMLLQATDSAERIRAFSKGTARELNSELWLRNTFLQVGLDTEGVALVGYPGQMEFWSRCETVRGWAEECRVRLEVLQPAGLGVSMDGGSPLTVLESLPVERFLYLFSSGGVTIGWRADWVGSDAPPAAVGLVTVNDTVVMRLGAER